MSASDPLSLRLQTFDQTWIEQPISVALQALRREALAAARLRLNSVRPNPSNCLGRITTIASDIHNNRPPHGDEQYYLQVRLEMFALIGWLLDYRLDGRMSIERVASQYDCPEITAILQSKPIE